MDGGGNDENASFTRCECVRVWAYQFFLHGGHFEHAGGVADMGSHTLTGTGVTVVAPHPVGSVDMIVSPTVMVR